MTTHDDARAARHTAWEARRQALEAASDTDAPRSRAPRVESVPLSGVRHPRHAPYAELHLHSCYSMLDGASNIEQLISAASSLGYHALALTDHNGLFGAIEFAQAAKDAGIQPITGLELTVAEEDNPAAPRSHLTLLAETREGYANLCRLASFAYGLGLETQKEKDIRRRDPWIDVHALESHARGLIVLSGCREGRISSLLAEGNTYAAGHWLDRLVRWFGPKNVFVELQDNLVFGDRARNLAMVELAGRAGVEVVGTGNVHYHTPDRHRLQDVLVAIRHRKTLDESHRERRPNAEFYLRSPAEQAERFAAYHPRAASNTIEIARRCTFDITRDLDYRLPSPPVADNRTPFEELEAVCRGRLNERYSTPRERQAAEARLAEELELVARHDLAGFFLIYHQVFELARDVAEEIRGRTRGRTHLPPGRGRGSSVSSIICYLIGLSHIDPIHSNLFIGRFLNEEMHSLPDIDLDFPRDIRAELIERVYDTWGKDHAALVATFPRYCLKSAVRDVGKALGLPAAELDRIAKRSGMYQDLASLPAHMARFPEYAGHLDAPGWRELIELAQQLEGFPRHLSQHVGGMVISSEPLINYVPCQPAAWPNRYICHWDKDSVDDARMVKIDFLALGMLSALEETLELIAEKRGELDLSRVPLDDPGVYDDICEGATVGVFQIESRAQVAMLPRTRPRTIEDLTVQVSIVRPGPIVGGAVNPYVRRREAQRTTPNYVPEVPHECVRPALEETLGVVIFQEQVLQVAQAMGRFTAGQADRFRRAMSRRRSHEEMERYREQFLEGARQDNVPADVAESVFENLLGFAEFGFPKSHGAAFGLLAYQTSWLKRYYPAEFFCGLFNNQPMGFYPPHVLTNDAKRNDIKVRRPDINISGSRCTVEDTTEARGAVRIGLSYVHGIGEATVLRIIEEREKAPFASLFDFVQRTGANREAVTSLIRVGAFDAFGLNRRELLWQLRLFGGGLQQATMRTPPRNRQLALPMPTEQDQVELDDFNAYERLAADYEVIALSPDGHPMQFLRPALGEGVASSRHLQSMEHGTRVDVAGLVVCRQRPQSARGIVFLLLEDEFGMLNILVSRELAERYTEEVHTARFLRARGVLEKQAGNQRTLVATALQALGRTAFLNIPDGRSWA